MWQTARNSAPLFTTNVGLAAKTTSCLLASRYSCYSNVIVKQRDGNMRENWVRRYQQKHSISFRLFALCRFRFINGKIWGFFCCVNKTQTANITRVTQRGAKCMFAIAVVQLEDIIQASFASRYALQLIGRLLFRTPSMTNVAYNRFLLHTAPLHSASFKESTRLFKDSGLGTSHQRASLSVALADAEPRSGNIT